MKTVTVVIPAYNEAATIGDVVSDVSEHVDVVLVVDDGSEDETSRIAESSGAKVLENGVNRGYDASLSRGVDWAVRNGADIVVTFDADGQHDPADIERVVEPIRSGRADIVVGRRPEPARPAERLFALYTTQRFGVEDPLSGFKAYDATLYDRLGYFDEYSSIGTHLMVGAIKLGYTVDQVNIGVDERDDEPRFGHLRANWVMLKALGRIAAFDLRTELRRAE